MLIFILLLLPIVLAETLQDSASTSLQSSKGSPTLSTGSDSKIDNSNSFLILLIPAIIIIVICLVICYKFYSKKNTNKKIVKKSRKK